MAIFDPKHESTDNYFDRLDAAFSALSASPRSVRPEATAEIEPAAGAGSSVIAETFAALLALEEGTPGAKPVRLVSSETAPQLTDAFVEELTSRVVQRLAPEAVRAVVVGVVSEIAEKLVKEEIARIRKGPNA